MKRFRGLLCLILVVTLFATMLVSCGTDTDKDTSATDSTASAAVSEIDETKQFPYPDYYNEATIRILCVETARHVYGELQFVPDEESNYSAVSAKVKERNDYIRSNYGLSIELYPVKYPDEELRKLALVNDSNIDLVCESVDRMLPTVTENYFWSLDDMLDMSKAWWDHNAIESLSIAGKHYFVCGDAIITDDDNTYLYLFNKDMYNNNVDLSQKYGDIYDLVRQNKFTVDTFTEICRAVSHPDETGSWGFEATYGNLSHAYGATVMMNGCNIATASQDKNSGYFTLNVMNGSSVAAFDKIYTLMSNKQLTQRAELIIGKGKNPSSYGFAELEEMFVSGRGLFYNTTSSSISILKTNSDKLDFDFGVLPIPLLNEDQDRYCNTVNRYQSTVLGIPVTNTGEHQKATCVLLQALGCYSEDVTKAYYQTTLHLQALTNSDDEEMLDLVYNNRFYDLGAMFGWGNNALISLYGKVISNDTDNTLVSEWEKIESSVDTDMKATIEAYKQSLM